MHPHSDLQIKAQRNGLGFAIILGTPLTNLFFLDLIVTVLLTSMRLCRRYLKLLSAIIPTERYYLPQLKDLLLFPQAIKPTADYLHPEELAISKGKLTNERLHPPSL